MTTINNVIIDGLGVNNKKFQVLHGLNENITIMDLKQIIFDRFNIPPKIYYFVLGSKTPGDNQTLKDVNLQPECTLYVRLRTFSKF